MVLCLFVSSCLSNLLSFLTEFASIELVIRATVLKGLLN